MISDSDDDVPLVNKRNLKNGDSGGEHSFPYVDSHIFHVNPFT